MRIKKELPTGAELYDLRHARRQAQEDAARSVGYRLQSWHSWEKGTREMPLCAWLVYQLGGIDAILNGEAFTPAKPAKPTWVDFKRFMEELENED